MIHTHTQCNQELQSKERSLQQRIMEQEKKEKQLNREKEEVKIKAEHLEMLIKRLSEQQSLDDGEEDETDSEPPAIARTARKQEVSVQRPPRLRLFSVKGLIKRLWSDRSGVRGRKVEGPLPSKVETGRAKTTQRMMSSPVSSKRRNPPVEIREKRSLTTSLTTPDAPAFGVLPAEKRASLPNVSHQSERPVRMMRGHRRLGSDDVKCECASVCVCVCTCVLYTCKFSTYMCILVYFNPLSQVIYSLSLFLSPSLSLFSCPC